MEKGLLLHEILFVSSRRIVQSPNNNSIQKNH